MKPPGRHPRLRAALALAGGGALLVAMATELLAVLGRHLGRPLIGSIELVQAAVLVAGLAAILSATLAGSHASVRLLVERAGPRQRSWLLWLGRCAAALFCVALGVGSTWLAMDLWSGREESELLHLSYRPLRLLVIAGIAVTALLFLRAGGRGPRP